MKKRIKRKTYEMLGILSTRTLKSVEDKRGVALLICLLVMAILTVVVLEFSYEVRVDAALTGNSFLALEAEYAARSGVTFCKAMIRQDAADDLALPAGQRTDNLMEEWALVPESIPVGRGSMVTTAIVDEDGKLCINRVINPKTYKADDKALLQLERLLAEFDMPPETTDTVLDWVDFDAVQREAGAEGDYYRTLPVPYVCKNTWFDSIDELVLVEGFTQDVVFGQRAPLEVTLFGEEEPLRGLADYLSVFGGRGGRVNVNTAPEPVLRAVFGQDTEVPSSIVASRENAPFENMADLKQRVPAVIAMKEIGKSVAFRSNRFSIVSEGVIQGVRLRIDTVVERIIPKDAVGLRDVSFRTLSWKVTR
jgi:general secretion pathway protein K